MSRNAALLIDLENFYLARETGAESGRDEAYDFSSDLERLCRFARELVGATRRLVVRRAYADFSALRSNDDAELGSLSRGDFMRHAPLALMDQGVEPIQVFQSPGQGSNGSSSAADLRLAIDAIALLSDIDFFVVVTGNRDLVPLVQQLRQRGGYVVGLGVHESITRTLTAFCDEFHEFDMLVAAEEQRGDQALRIDDVARVMQELLKERGRLNFARVKPLIDQRLGRPLELSAFGSETMGGFLHEHASELGVVVTRAIHDWELSLPSQGSEIVLSAPELRSHSVALYRRMLQAAGKVRLHVHDHREWLAVTKHLYDGATDSSGKPVTIFHGDLRSLVIDRCADDGLHNVGKTTNDALFLIFKAGCFVCAEPGPRYGETDFNWTNYGALLAPTIGSLEQLRHRAYSFAIGCLSERLEDYDGRQPDPKLVAELLFGADYSDDEVARAQQLITDAPDSRLT